MKKHRVPACNLFIACLLFSSFCYGQFNEIIKSGGKLLEKSPTKLMDKYFSNAPITTSFDHAQTEVMLLGSFDPDATECQPLSVLRQNENGDYLVTEGYYSGYAKSFCMKAGTYGPSQGDGHLYAPLAGPKSHLVRKIFENWQTRRPEIPQSDVQGLIWAIIARVDVDKMDTKYKLTLAALLDKSDIAQLAANSLKDKALEAGMIKFKGEIPAEVYKVFEAERNLRSLYNSAGTTYEQLERQAVLAGVAPASEMIRPVSRARWSFHPGGYFIRLFPQGYSSTRVDVYLPIKVEAAADELGRIKSLSYEGIHKAEFIYARQTPTIDGKLNSSGIIEIKVFQAGFPQMVSFKPAQSLNTGFAAKDFSFNSTTVTEGTQLAEYAKLFNEPKGLLTLDLDATSKTNLFNLANLAQAVDAIPAQSIDVDLRSYIRYMIDEAYNYSLFKNLSIKNPRAQLNTELGDAQVKNSGPFVKKEKEANEDVLYREDEFTSHDPGVLNFPSTVATPANRASQRIGVSRDPKPKPWYDKLPPCPCTYTEAQKLAKQNGSGWMDCGAANQTYHYGASTEVRWKPSKHGQPGQQCTYDANGNLITSGIAAGSPDIVSPQGCGPQDGISYGEIRNFPGHNWNDMRTWENMPCWQYLQDWPANNANNCSPSNPVYDPSRIKNIVGNMNCRDFTNLMNGVNNSKNISKALKDHMLGKPGSNLSDKDLNKEFSDWYRKESCPGSDLCNSIRTAFSNIQPGN
jgi:hypothetical protein